MFGNFSEEGNKGLEPVAHSVHHQSSLCEHSDGDNEDAEKSFERPVEGKSASGPSNAGLSTQSAYKNGGREVPQLVLLPVQNESSLKEHSDNDGEVAEKSLGRPLKGKSACVQGDAGISEQTAHTYGPEEPKTVSHPVHQESSLYERGDSDYEILKRSLKSPLEGGRKVPKPVFHLVNYESSLSEHSDDDDEVTGKSIERPLKGNSTCLQSDTGLSEQTANAYGDEGPKPAFHSSLYEHSDSDDEITKESLKRPLEGKSVRRPSNAGISEQPANEYGSSKVPKPVSHPVHYESSRNEHSDNDDGAVENSLKKPSKGKSVPAEINAGLSKQSANIYGHKGLEPVFHPHHESSLYEHTDSDAEVAEKSPGKPLKSKSASVRITAGLSGKCANEYGRHRGPKQTSYPVNHESSLYELSDSDNEVDEKSLGRPLKGKSVHGHRNAGLSKQSANKYGCNKGPKLVSHPIHHESSLYEHSDSDNQLDEKSLKTSLQGKSVPVQSNAGLSTRTADNCENESIIVVGEDLKPVLSAILSQIKALNSRLDEHDRVLAKHSTSSVRARDTYSQSKSPQNSPRSASSQKSVDHDVRHDDRHNDTESGKVEEIKPESGVYVDAIELSMMRRWKGKPAEMIRRLMLCLVGAEALKTMTARGTKEKQGIPTRIFSAVKYYIDRHSRPVLSQPDYVRVINLQISNLRNPKPKSTKATTQTSSDDQE